MSLDTRNTRSASLTQDQKTDCASGVFAEHCSKICQIANTALKLLANYTSEEYTSPTTSPPGSPTPSITSALTIRTTATTSTTTIIDPLTDRPRPRIPFQISTEITAYIHSIAESLIFLIYLRSIPSFKHNAEHWRRWNFAFKKFLLLCYEESKWVRGEELTVEDVVKWVPPVSPREVERALSSLEQSKQGKRGRVSWRGTRFDEASGEKLGQEDECDGDGEDAGDDRGDECANTDETA